MNLNELKTKESATVINILGGDEVKRRVETLGIRPGKSLVKISAHFWRGPVTILLGKTKIAIGHGMANKIIVEK